MRMRVLASRARYDLSMANDRTLLHNAGMQRLAAQARLMKRQPPRRGGEAPDPAILGGGGAVYDSSSR